MAGTGHIFAFYAVLPSDLLERAYRSVSGELAWNRADAVRVVALAQRYGFTVSLIETWLPTRPGPTPLIDNWQDGGAMSAEAFIETFRWEPTDAADNGLEVHFNIWAEPLDVSLQ